MYLVPAELMARFGPQELTEAATPDDRALVTPELLRATINASDRSEWSADEIAVADETLARIEALLADAAQFIDGYLRARYSLPLDPVPTSLKRVAGDVARYYLHEDRATDEIQRRYKDAVKLLESIAAGEVTLGAQDPSPATAGAPQVSTPGRVFTRDSLRDFGA